MEASSVSHSSIARKPQEERKSARKAQITNPAARPALTFIAPPVRGICRVTSGRRPLQVHGESNNYVFPLSSCSCVWSKHNVMAKRASANHGAHTAAGIFSSQSALTHWWSGRSASVRRGARQTHRAIFTASVN